MTTTKKPVTIIRPQSSYAKYNEAKPWGEAPKDLFKSRAVQWFFKLTAETSPSPHDIQWFKEFLIANNLLNDMYEQEGNFIQWVGEDERTFQTLFVGHFDTADFGQPRKISRKYANGIVRTDGTTVLGADDKAGVAIMLAMIEAKVPGTYMFVHGEERGRKGSTVMAKQGWADGYKRAIQFDRYGTDSIITHQMGEQSCSMEFAEELSLMLGTVHPQLVLMPDDGGVYTDTYSFHSIIPECTNISVGYYNQHTNRERQDLVFLAALADACIQIPWEKLPTVQNPDNRESMYSKYRNYNMSGYGDYGGTYSDYLDYEADWDPASPANMGKTRMTIPDEFWEEDEAKNAPWTAKTGGTKRKRLLDEILAEADAGRVDWTKVKKLVEEFPLEAADLLYEFLDSEVEAKLGV